MRSLMADSDLRKQKLIFLTQVFYPDQSSTSQLFSVLVRQLVDQGFDVTVYAGRTVERKNNDKKIVNIVECGLRVDHKRNLVLRFLAYVSYLLHCFWLLLKTDRRTVVMAVTNPPMNAQLLYLASLIKKFKYEYFFLDVYPEGLEALGKLKNKYIATAWRYLNLLSYRRAQNLYCLGRDMMELISKNYNINPNELTYLPHWSASENPRPIDFVDSNCARELNLLDKFVVQYSGNMGIWHDMKTFVRAAKLLEDNDNIVFLFVGDGVKKQSARKLADELNVRNIIWKDFVPFDQLPDSLAGCHVSLISLRDGLEGVAVPCKFYGILESERCVLALVPVKSEIAMAIDDDDTGFHIKPGEHQELVEKIRLLSEKSELVNVKAKNARRAYENKYSLESAVNKLVKTIKW